MHHQPPTHSCQCPPTHHAFISRCVIKVATGQEENEEEEKHPFGSPKEMESLHHQRRMLVVGLGPPESPRPVYS